LRAPGGMMEKLEKRIIEIRENINFLDERMNETYSAYEIAKDKKEDAEVNLEILNGQKKEIASKIFNKQFSKVSIVLMPLNFILFGYLTIINLNFDKMPLINCLTLILSGLFLSLVSGILLSIIVVKILKLIIPSDILFISIDKEIGRLKKEDKLVNKKIKSTSKLLEEYKNSEKEYADMYSSLCLKYNSSKELLDEIEDIYFDKTKSIISDLKTYNLYALLNSLSEDDREYIIDSIKNNFINCVK
jgi:septal ring factor EnvC (AmiA/AmiB activator)